MMVVLVLLSLGALVAPMFQGLELLWEYPWTEILNSPKFNLDAVPISLELTQKMTLGKSCWNRTRTWSTQHHFSLLSTALKKC